MCVRSSDSARERVRQRERATERESMGEGKPSREWESLEGEIAENRCERERQEEVSERERERERERESFRNPNFWPIFPTQKFSFPS